jgi:hypothetical protein
MCEEHNSQYAMMNTCTTYSKPEGVQYQHECMEQLLLRHEPFRAIGEQQDHHDIVTTVHQHLQP